jgi:hypothetical protein
MLNPSKADHADDDPTIRKVRGFSKRLEYGGFVVVNLYAFRSTKKSALPRTDAEGQKNWEAIHAAAQGQRNVMLAWGSLGRKAQDAHASEVVRLLRHQHPDTTLLCLDKTASGQPRHPLMLAYSTPVQVF